MTEHKTLLTKENIDAILEGQSLHGYSQPFSVGNGRYIAVLPPQYLPASCQVPSSFATVIDIGGQLYVTKERMQEFIDDYNSKDDVFHNDFLRGVIFTGAVGGEAAISAHARKLLQSLGNEWILTVGIENGDATPNPGPYVASKQTLYEVWKLYDDVQGAFLASLITNSTNEPVEYHISGEYPQSISIAVPSRLQTQTSSEQPLSGLRVGVKDIYEIKGLPTSVCNRAYYELYPPPPKTAACIEILQKAGAKIVGTTKLASFAATEEPIECVDFQAPWNPRGDGYQSPAGSSSGSGAAIASYPWLDISIGSDTSGSGRRPGHWNGCFAIRPSHGVLPVEGYIPSFRQFDVPTFFGRDIKKCKDFAKHWYGEALPHHDHFLPPSIVYAIDYISSISNKEQLNVIDQFVTDLEKSLGVKREQVSFDTLWETSPPIEAKGLSLHDYMRDACRNSFFYDDYHNFDKFRGDYQRQFSKTPYISPPVRWQWTISASITEAERDTAVERLEVYRKWFSTMVMRVGQYNSLVILPIEEISPRYRDEPPKKHFYPLGVPMLFLSPILRGPELVIPAGQVPYKSKVSGRMEHLPIGISLLASPGRDVELLDLSQKCLEQSGRPLSVLAGKEMFSSSITSQ